MKQLNILNNYFIMWIFMEIKEKMDSLRNYFHGKKVLVAFSGGADSTLLALVAKEEAKEALAVTVDNGVMPPECIQKAEQIAGKIGITHQILKMNFLKDPAFGKNPPNRCYICKNKIYHQLKKISKEYHFDFVADGTNISDLLEDRPGIIVNIEKNIKTPLVASELTAPEVRTILHDLGIDYHPSTTCFATRIPAGRIITPKKISRIAYAENLIRNLTRLNLVRVRDDEGLALIEVEDVNKLIDKGLLSHLDSELKAVGFKKVTIAIGSYGNSEKEMVVYKPCKDEKNKIMFETELPYSINISETCQELATLGSVKCSSEMGIAMLEIDERNITFFEKGKIVARKVKDMEDAQKILVKVLPCLRRQK
jgi:pyridinium-3,5-biscarboxylic acid mononucleotide sulfurtransferase